MNKEAILLSVNPYWCSLLGRKKTLEIRKTEPKLKNPFKVFVYCTKNNHSAKDFLEIHASDGIIRPANSMVFAEFVCDYIKAVDVPYPAFKERMDADVLKQSCVPYLDLHHYAGSKCVYAWHVSDFAVYDVPRPVTNFVLLSGKQVTRAPQSWCYVEEQ